MSQTEEILRVLESMMSSPWSSVSGYSHLTDEPGQPFHIRLEAAAAHAAADLHARFGSAVRLEVGLFPYPDITSRPFRLPPRPELPVADERRDFRCELDGPLTVASGESVSHALLLTSAMTHEVEVHTNGALSAMVTDPSDGHIVGGFVGAVDMPLVAYPLNYGRTVRIPLGVGTASFDPTLGYTVPPGDWTLAAVIWLSDGRRLLTPPLNFRVIEA